MLIQNKVHESKQKTSLAPVAEREEVHLSLDGELNLADYIQDKPASSDTVHEIKAWVEQQREKTRTAIAMRFITLFGGTLTATFILMGVAAFNPSADKPFIKDLASLAVTSQVGLLGTALGYYFGNKEK